MQRLLVLLFAVLAYSGFFGWFLYAICFLAEWSVPKTINSGPEEPLAASLLINLSLVLVFALQHTVMARSGFKRWWKQFIPDAAERGVFVMISALVLGLLLWQWRPLPQTLWNIQQPTLAALLRGLSLTGAGIVLYATFLIDHWDLVGLRQAWAYFRKREPVAPVFTEPAAYRLVRHPMMVGVLIWFWATPHMTWGHLLFAVSMTIYVVIGICFEERGLLDELGDDYADYRRRVPALIPRLWQGKPPQQ